MVGVGLMQFPTCPQEAILLQQVITYHSADKPSELKAEEGYLEMSESCEFLKKQWPLMSGWKIQSCTLTTIINQIERRLRFITSARKA
ncbi:hypothetical protein Ccrd_008867 [Cynara cardunculus var. scolymus]|uniref:Uncharacterized protein n=1 Tax=Cynara cardunculus var. scolymus TaxID=59895 RepID=A0A103XEA7_CYNCS|nr:hypothetical protein Ccrd_008867 [Cynara cardunculus var. scolymus]